MEKIDNIVTSAHVTHTIFGFLSCIRVMVRYNDITIRIGPQLTYIDQTQTVDIPQTIKDSLRKFRFARRSAGSAALVIKINKEDLVMEEVEQFDNISIEELAEGMYSKVEH